MISIVIPLYNKEKQIESTLHAVFSQTFQNFELVVVDDGSTDRSLDYVEKHKDSRIKIVTQPNQGVSIARNTGIHHATYNYIAFLDADDLWLPDYLESIVYLIQNYPDCSVYATSYFLRRHDGIDKKIILNKMPFSTETGILTHYFEVASHSHPPLWTSAVAAKKEALLAIGGFPPGIKAGEDLLTWARLAISYKIAYNREPKAFFVQSIAESYATAPSRVPSQEDFVGQELLKLIGTVPKTKGLRSYVALWFKMRASMFLLLGDRKNTILESFKCLKIAPVNIKVYIYLFLIIIPLKLRRIIFQKFGNQ